MKNILVLIFLVFALVACGDHTSAPSLTVTDPAVSPPVDPGQPAQCPDNSLRGVLSWSQIGSDVSGALKTPAGYIVSCTNGTETHQSSMVVALDTDVRPLTPVDGMWACKYKAVDPDSGTDGDWSPAVTFTRSNGCYYK